MICQKCSSESPDGSVFCNTCGARIVVWAPEDIYSELLVDDDPFYEEQFLGETRRYTRAGYMMRLVPWSIFMVVFSVTMTVGGYVSSSRGVMVAGLFLLSLFSVVLLVNALVLRHYRETGRPINWGGMGPGHPKAEDVMAIEDDSLDGYAGSDDADSYPDADSVFVRR